MSVDKRDWEDLSRTVSTVLYRFWDPIGVCGEPGARDEYESYVLPVTGALLGGTTIDEVADLLSGFETREMGIGPAGREHLLAVAHVLKWEHDLFTKLAQKEAHVVDAVLAANKALPTSGLVTAHSGNVSGLDRDMNRVYIKPSGMDYHAMTWEDVSVVELDSGHQVAGLKPSVDLPHHLFLYRNMPEVRGIVHTHSNYATAFAANGLSIPPVLTAVADEFGGEVPCAPYVDNEGDHIGQAILAHKTDRAPAILLAHHGVFAWGPDPAAALKAAVMVEDTAKTIWLARQLGTPQELPADEIEKWWDRYQNRYGQG